MELQNERYYVGEQDLLSLTEEFGTPLYVYNGDKIIEQYNTLKNAFSGQNIKLKYACKALTNINILKLLKNQGAGIDAVSINEIKIALKAGFTASDIMFTPNCAEYAEVLEAVERIFFSITARLVDVSSGSRS